MEVSFIGVSIIAFLFGAIIGSFINVVTLRIGKSSIVFGRSHCPHCKHVLAPYELVPIFSYIFLFGRCKKCKKHISWQYPIVEFLMGVGTAAAAFATISQGFHPLFFISATLVVGLFLAIVVYDFKHTIVPDSFVYPLALFTFVALFINPVTFHFLIPSISSLLAGPALAFPFLALWILSKGKWIGLGDAKLALPIGWMLGISAGFTALAISFWAGAVVSVVLLLVSRLRLKKQQLTMKSEVPFAPFLVFGTFLVYITGLNFFLII